MAELEVVPISFSEAAEFIRKHHRHHIPPVGHKFSLAAATQCQHCHGEGIVSWPPPQECMVCEGACLDKIVGVATVGRPVARHMDDGWTLEVNRVATDGHKNACSLLYAAAWRAAKSMGYKRLITYTLDSESGASLRGAGWRVLHEVSGRSWSCKSRPRVDKHPLQNKICWSAT